MGWALLGRSLAAVGALLGCPWGGPWAFLGCSLAVHGLLLGHSLAVMGLSVGRSLGYPSGACVVSPRRTMSVQLLNRICPPHVRVGLSIHTHVR